MFKAFKTLVQSRPEIRPTPHKSAILLLNPIFLYGFIYDEVLVMTSLVLKLDHESLAASLLFSSQTSDMLLCGPICGITKYDDVTTYINKT